MYIQRFQKILSKGVSISRILRLSRSVERCVVVNV